MYNTHKRVCVSLLGGCYGYFATMTTVLLLLHCQKVLLQILFLCIHLSNNYVGHLNCMC